MLSIFTSQQEILAQIEGDCVARNNVVILNPLSAKFFRVNINMHLHFISFLHIGKTQVLKIIPQIR